MNSFLNQDDNTTNVDNEYLFVETPFSADVPLYSGLHDFEQTLRCTICHEFFQIPVSLLSCHHTFCSGCIRDFIKSSKKGMKRCADCPICRVKVSGDESKYLIPNRTIEILVRQYKALRSDLSASLSLSIVATTNNTSEMINSSQEEEEVKQAATEEHETADGEPSKRRRTSRSPLCDSSTVTTAAMPATQQQPQQQRLVRKTTTHYNALKRKDLIQLCQDAKLSTRGTDRELRARHEEYVKLYNAQCDSYHPMSESQMARAVMEREEKIKKESKKHIEHAAALAQLKENRTQMGQDSEARGTALSGNAALDAEMKAHFAKMIPKEQLEKRKRKWVDTTPEPALNGNQQHVKSEAASQVAVTNETASMAKPINTAARANKPPANTNLASMPVINPYSAKKKSTNENVPPSSSARKPSNTNTTTMPTSTENSARKPPPRPSLMTNFLQPAGAVAAPTPRKLSLSQQSTSSTTSNSSRIIGPWACGACTFVNEKNKWSRATCELCGTPRPGPNDAADEQREENSNMVLLDV